MKDTFNLNEHVWVKLTPSGRKRLKEDYFDLCGCIPSPTKEVNGWSDWQLWELMSRLGRYCKIGFGPHPFEPTISFTDPNESESQ